MKIAITPEAAANNVARQIAASITSAVSNAANAIKTGVQPPPAGPNRDVPALSSQQIKDALGAETVELIGKLDALVNPPAAPETK